MKFYLYNIFSEIFLIIYKDIREKLYLILRNFQTNVRVFIVSHAHSRQLLSCHAGGGPFTPFPYYTVYTYSDTYISSIYTPPLAAHGLHLQRPLC